MKNLFIIFIITITTTCMLTSCNQEDCSTLKPMEAPHDNRAYEQLCASIIAINSKYKIQNSTFDNGELFYAKNRKGFFHWLGRIFTTIAGNVAGSISIGPTGNNYNLKQGIDTSATIWKLWEDKKTEEKDTSKTRINHIGAENKPTIKINTDAIPKINGQYIEDNAGYIHNAVIINLYKEYGDSLKELSASDIDNIINKEYHKVINEAGLIHSTNNHTNEINKYVVDRICALVSQCSDVEEFIMVLKAEYPECAKELEVLEIVMNNIINENMEVENLDDYTNEVVNTINGSQIPTNSKDVIKATVSITSASSQLWTP